MSQTISGYQNTTQTLSSGAQNVTIVGTINAYGFGGVYSVHNNGSLTPATISTAVFGPAGTDFTIDNTGLIETHGTNSSNPFDVGILLGSPGNVVNSGTIDGASGIAIFSNSNTSTAFINNSNLIDGSIGVGIYIASAGSVINSGSIAGAQTGVNLSRTAASYLSNSSTGTITAGVNYAVQLYEGVVNNAGVLKGFSGGVQLYQQGTILNAGAIEATGTVLGTNGSYAGIEIQQGGIVHNSLSGTISGLTGIRLQGSAASYIDNAGKITGTKAEGIVSDTVFTVKNTGTISGVYDAIASYNPGGASTINNYGLVIATGSSFTVGTVTSTASGISLAAGGTITNQATGQITGDLGVYLSGGVGNNAIYLDNLGTITGTAANGVNLETSGKVFNSGQITGAADGVYLLNGGKVVNAGTITGNDGIAVKFGGTTGTVNQLGVDPGAVFNGTVEVTGGTGVLKLASGSSAGTISGIGTSFQNFETIDIQTGSSWVIEGSFSGLASGQTIAGFANTDTIILDGFTATSETYVSGVGLELSNGTGTEILNISGAFATANFSISSNASGTVIKEVTCYAKGTRIATADGEVAVEDLEIGDTVQTMHAGFKRIKWIGMRSYAAPFANHAKVLPIHIKAGALAENIPARDLFVSPGHAIYFDGVLVHAARLVNGISVLQLPCVDEITYFHIELENHEIIFAENCPAETFMGEYFRPQFHNAESYHALYPNESAPEHMCLPRLDNGFQLAAIQRRLAERAGIVEKALDGPLRGYVDIAGPTLCAGWAQNAADPNKPVCLDIFSQDRRIGRVLANMYREDVREARCGNGYQGFEFVLPEGTAMPVDVRRSTDGACLPLTEAARVVAA
ncbi:MAG: Hint domain-containing protein [Proteobacteria bacterium]|nr:Hint domain-containing protein [Pseudomonadota bacterium]